MKLKGGKFYTLIQIIYDNICSLLSNFYFYQKNFLTA